MLKRALTAEDWAAPLEQELRARGDGPVVLVSQGASLPIALALIERAPDLVSRLVAISPLAGGARRAVSSAAGPAALGCAVQRADRWPLLSLRQATSVPAFLLREESVRFT